MTNAITNKISFSKVKGLHITGRRWFDRKNGNTYHKVYIYAGTECIYESGITYGYGDCYIQTACEWLTRNIKGIKNPDKLNYTRLIREVFKGSWSVADVSAKRDM